jgi:excisionase family DNA binding protein
MILINLERQESLMEFKELAPRMKVQESTLRQWVHRGKLIAVRRGKKLYSHSRLFVE